MKIENIKKRAAEAAAKLIAKLPPGSDVPRTEMELITCINEMAKHPRLYGVILTRPEKRALDFVHGMVKARLEKAAEMSLARQKAAALTTEEQIYGKDMPTVSEDGCKSVDLAEGAGGAGRIQ